MNISFNTCYFKFHLKYMHGSRGWGQRGGLAEGSIQIFLNYNIKFQKYAPRKT